MAGKPYLEIATQEGITMSTVCGIVYRRRRQM